MNKKNLSFISLLSLSVALLGGCGDGNRNVNDTVLQVGNDKYTAEQLYNQLLASGTGANEAFSMVLRLVIESSMKTNKNLQAAADMAEEKFEEEVENNAKTNGISVKDARKALLKEKGYESVEEMKADIIYEQKKSRVTEQYWEKHKTSEEFYGGYIKNRLPYLVKHVLLKIDDNTNGNKIANNVNVSQTEAEKLYDIINRFKNGDTFSYVANHFSEDPGSIATGGAYYMDTTTSFVDEYLYGTYIFDAYTEKVTEGNETYYKWYRTDKYDILKSVGFINEDVYDVKDDVKNDQLANYYENGLNLVTMDLVEKINDVANKTNTGDFHYIGYVGSEDFVSDTGVTEYDSSLNNLNSNYNAYARSIIFNRAFNKPGLSVVGYTEEPKPEDGVKNYVRIKDVANDKDMWVLTDENKNPIFFVAAKGSSNDVWLHFLTIDFSTLQDAKNNYVNAKKFFTIDPKDDDDYVSYVENPIFNVDGTKDSKRKLISEIEGYIKSYVTAGAGGTVGEESLLSYAMLSEYMKNNEISWASKGLEDALNAYMSNRKVYFEMLHKNNMLTTFNKHVDKLEVSQDPLVQKGIKPYECAVVLDSDVYAPINNSTSTGNLCRYVYGEGYQVRLSYFYHTDLLDSGNSYTRITTSTDVISFKKQEGVAGEFDQWVFIGEENSDEISLPTLNEMNLKTGYEFRGWFLDKECTIPVENNKIDLSVSSIYNQTVFYAKVVTVTQSGDYQVKYNYRYEGTNTVADANLITNTNIQKAPFSDGGANNVHTIYTNNTADSKTITSTQLEILGFDTNGDGEVDNANEFTFELNGENLSQGVTVTVIVKPIANDIEYVFVEEDSTEAGKFNDITTSISTDLTEATTEFVYDTTGSENLITIDTSKISVDGYTVEEFKYAIQDVPTFDLAKSSLKLSETNIGKKITVYVVLKATASE